MSHYMTALAMKQQGLKPATKIVLYWLADHHNGETNKCFPSLTRLAECCEMDKTTVIRHIDFLMVHGYVRKKKEVRKDGGYTSNSYILNLAEPKSQNTTSPSGKMQPPLVAKHDTNQGSSNLGSNEVVFVRSIDEVIDFFKEFWSLYPRKIGKAQAEKVFAKALTKIEGDELLQKVELFSEVCKGKDQKFIPHAATWLNQERWNDEIEVPKENLQHQVLNDLIKDREGMRNV